MSTFEGVITGYCLFLAFFWLGVKGVLSSQGFPVSLAWPSLRDFDYLNQIIQERAGSSASKSFSIAPPFILRCDCLVLYLAVGAQSSSAVIITGSDQMLQPP
jgi:hypothetical protein